MSSTLQRPCLEPPFLTCYRRGRPLVRTKIIGDWARQGDGQDQHVDSKDVVPRWNRLVVSNIGRWNDGFKSKKHIIIYSKSLSVLVGVCLLFRCVSYFFCRCSQSPRNFPTAAGVQRTVEPLRPTASSEWSNAFAIWTRWPSCPESYRPKTDQER